MRTRQRWSRTGSLSARMLIAGTKLPSDLLGFTCVRYDEATNPSEMRAINQKLRKAIESEGRVARIEGLWWQFSLTARGPQ
jgi:hypothetical protein